MATRKLVAPIAITAVTSLWAIGQSIVVLMLLPEINTLFAVIGIALPLVSVGLMIFVLIERVKEVKSGEEDDLDNY